MTSSDFPIVRAVYADAVESQTDSFSLYNDDQIKAWAALAWLPGILDKPLKEGIGWISCEKQSVEAFALRYPLNRLALLYCRGRSSRRGHATSLLQFLEQDAVETGQKVLFTEASLFSYPLLLKCGWSLESLQTIKIGGVPFQRYLMQKKLYK